MAIRNRHWHTEAVENTAYAPQEVARRGDKSVAAICSDDAAAINGLAVLPESICDTNCNKTRFIAVARRLVVTPDASRLGIIMNLPHRIGALSAALEVISDRGLNLAAISSQPVADKPWEYAFFVDILAPALDPVAMSAICQLSYELPRLQIIGWYGEAGNVKLDQISRLIAAGQHLIVADSVYSWTEYKALKRAFPGEVIVVAILASRRTRHKRLAKRPDRPFTTHEATERDWAEIEKLEKGGPIAIADYFITNESSLESLYAQIDTRLEDTGFVI